MSRKIVGVTVGTPLGISAIKEKLNPVTSVNGVEADENGNVEITIPASGGKSDYVVQDTAPEDTSVLWVDPDDNYDDGVVAVTGATVGQTVKISAVDETGTPTAWEPTDFPSGGSGGSSGGTKWEPLVNEVWQRNREFRFTEYNAETLTYTFPDGTFTDDEIGTVIGTMLVLDPGSLPDKHTNAGSFVTKLTPISGSQATIPSAQVDTLNGKNYWFEIPTRLSIKGVNARKIRVRWDGCVEKAFHSGYDSVFAYGMPYNQAVMNNGYAQFYPIRSIADIELELIDPFVVSGHQNAYIYATSANDTYHKKWFQSYSPVMQENTNETEKNNAYSADGYMFKELHWTNTPWLGNGGQTYFIGNGTRIYIAREIEA